MHLPRPRLIASALVLSAFACGSPPPPVTPAPAPPPPAPTVVANPDDPPVPTLRTGDLPPTEVTLSVHGVKHVVHGDAEILEVAVGARGYLYPNPFFTHLDAGAGALPGFAFAISDFAGRGGDDVEAMMTIWVRRPASLVGAPLHGAVLEQAIRSKRSVERPGRRLTFHVDTKNATPLPALEHEWALAAAQQFRSLRYASGDFATFAADRMERWADRTAKTRGPDLHGRERHRSSNELGEDIGVLSGTHAVDLALALENLPRGSREKAGADVPARSVTPLALPAHPWGQMSHGGHHAPPEPLAAVTPAEFYFVRARDLPTLDRALDQVDAWGTAAMNLVEDHPDDREMATRYETELGVKRGSLVRELGAKAIGQVALVGSDLYLSEGADVSMILEVKSRTLLDVGLASALAQRADGHGTVASSIRQHAGVPVSVSTTADGAVHRERADVGELTILSNSPHAMDLILDTTQEKHASLAHEPDLAYTLSRDVGTPDGVLAFIGDRFLTALASPRTRILAGRRRLAEAQLSLPGYAALLHGWIFGRSPASRAELLKTGLLDASELVHTMGGPITFEPGHEPRSTWGTPSRLVPLLDLPTPERFTKSEAESYEVFARMYRQSWTGYVDPLAVRVSFDGDKMNVDLRQLPIPADADFRELETLAGDVRVTVPPLPSGVRFTAAIGKDSRLRREANDILHSVMQGHESLLDWLGDTITVGMLDKSALASAVRRAGYVPEAPGAGPDATGSRSDREVVAFLSLPLYASIDVKNVMTAGLLLAGLHKEIVSNMSDNVAWDTLPEKEGKATITRIHFTGHEDLGQTSLYYAFTDSELVFALSESVLRQVLRARTAGDKASATHSRDEGAQHTLEIAGQPGDGLFTALAWLWESNVGDAETARISAETFFRGAPELAGSPALGDLAAAYTGSRPVTPEGTPLSWSDEGAVDPVRGSAVHPRWSTLPIPGSPIARVLGSLARVSTSIAFDDESDVPPSDADARTRRPLRSLHAHASFVLR